MFIISKQNITAQVSLIGGSIKVVPTKYDERFLKAHTAILATINILAQIHLRSTNAIQKDEIAREFFITNGWIIKA